MHSNLLLYPSFMIVLIAVKYLSVQTCVCLSVVILTIILRHVLQSAIFCMQATNMFDAVLTMKYIKSRKAIGTFEMILKILTEPPLTVGLQGRPLLSELFISRSCLIVVFTSA